MRMMTVPECLKALNGRVTDAQLRYGIRQGYYKSLRIGGKLLVDYDTICIDIDQYTPQHVCPGGLVSQEELIRRTGLSRRQIHHGIEEGWITPVTPSGRRRPMYRLQQVQTYLQVNLTRKKVDDVDDQ